MQQLWTATGIGSALVLAPLDFSVVTGCHINYIYSVSKCSQVLYVCNRSVIPAFNQSSYHFLPVFWVFAFILHRYPSFPCSLFLNTADLSMLGFGNCVKSRFVCLKFRFFSCYCSGYVLSSEHCSNASHLYWILNDERILLMEIDTNGIMDSAYRSNFRLIPLSISDQSSI